MGFEPTISDVTGRRFRPLSYGAIFICYYMKKIFKQNSVVKVLKSERQDLNLQRFLCAGFTVRCLHQFSGTLRQSPACESNTDEPFDWRGYGPPGILSRLTGVNNNLCPCNNNSFPWFFSFLVILEKSEAFDEIYWFRKSHDFSPFWLIVYFLCTVLCALLTVF